MIHSAKLLVLWALLAVLFSSLTACTEEPPVEEGSAEATPTPYPTPEGLTELPEGDNTLQGTAAYGAAAAYADVCLVGSTRCTRANIDGEYNLTPIEPDSGYLSANFLNASGASQTLYSYFAFTDAPAETVHINPSTDTIARIAAILDCTTGLPPATDCLAAPETIASTLGGIQTLLGPLWPEGRNPFTGPFEANPDTDELDRLHETIDYLINGQQLEIVDLNGTLLARADLLQLDDLALGTIPAGAQVVTEELAELARSAYQTVQPPQQNERFEMIVSVSPANATGPTQFASQVRVRANPAQETNEAARARFTLLYFDGRTAEWEQDFGQPLNQSFTDIDSGSFWLTEPGRYELIVDLLIIDNLAAESLVLTSSQQVTVGLVDGADPITYQYGAEGSCYSQPADNTRDFYFCFESANGLTYSDGEQNNGLDALCSITDDDYPFLRQPGRCPTTVLHGGFYSGYCTLTAGYGRIYFYQSPVRDYGAVGGAIALAELRCTSRGGAWTPVR
ncbi:hypothetical protein [Salinibius halmophilus]|uniref:hypothetical protein n=1 Tax=Salinibius halmophilus TaxID=1853216 RepID=UPI000E66FE25|nr:hypothetical protein [Salinibius halmophilus]